MGTVQHLGPGAGRITGDLGDLMPSPFPRARARRPDRVQKFVRNAGEVLITLGLVVLLLVVYEVYWTDLVSAGKQRDATSALDNRWQDQGTGADAQRQDHFQGLGEGDGFAKMYIPAFGADYHFTIVEGITATRASRSAPATTRRRSTPASPATSPSPATGSARARRSTTST